MSTYRFEQDKQDGTGRLNLIGGVTIEGTSHLRDLFIEIINKSDNLVLDLSEVEECDFAFLQLCCSLFKTAAALNKTLTFYDNDNIKVQNLITASGFMNIKGFEIVPRMKENNNV